MNLKQLAVILSLLSLVTFSVTKSLDADLVQGDLLGVFDGNDSAGELTEILTEMFPELLGPNQFIKELARVDLPETSADGLVLSELVFDDDDDDGGDGGDGDDDELLSGRWDYSGLACRIPDQIRIGMALQRVLGRPTAGRN